MTEQAPTHLQTGSSVDIRPPRGVVSGAEIEQVDQAVAALLTRCTADVSDVRVRLAGANCAHGPGLVQINLTVDGRAARVQVSGRSVRDAIDAATRRLEWKLRLLVPIVSAKLAGWPDPERRPFGIALPGEIARTKSVPLATTTPVAAGTTLVAMDYDAHLFTDQEHGEEAIVYRGGPSGLRLSRQRSMRPPTDRTIPTIVVDTRRPSTMTAAQAADWLARYHLPHVFFTDHATHRGALLYRRYDGNLTLVTPEQPR